MALQMQCIEEPLLLVGEGGVAEGGAVLATQQRAGLKHGGMTTGTGWRRNSRLRVFMGPQA